MADDALQPLKKLVDAWVQATALGMSGIWWFEEIAPEELLKLCDRKPVVDKLRRLMAKDHFPGDWLPLKASADYMAQLEGGYRNRHRTRLQCLGGSAGVQQAQLLSFLNDVLNKVVPFTAES